MFWTSSGDFPATGMRSAKGHADRTVASHHLLGDGHASRTRGNTGDRRRAEKPAARRLPDRHRDGVADPDFGGGRLAVFLKPLAEAFGPSGQQCRDHFVVDVDHVKTRLVVLDGLINHLPRGRPGGRQS